MAKKNIGATLALYPCPVIVVGAMVNLHQCLTESDKEMDRRAQAAVKAAIERAKIMKKPIARYDVEKKQVYLEYPNGDRDYSM